MIFPSKKVILVTGANGQLGKEFRHLSKSQDLFEFLFASRENLDITNIEDVQSTFRKFEPDYCINCAAYTAVDKAEEERDKAFLINETGVTNLITACSNTNCKLIHFSTDYVYHSIENIPISESDICAPKSIYAQSKRAGELALVSSSINWLCFRVSWLYSSFNNNFVKTMLRLGELKSELSIVSDQTGAPTYARDLAEDIFEIISKEESDIEYQQFFNYCNNGQTNWAAFAKEIFRLKNISCKINEISTQEYGAAAPRPMWSVLSLEKIRKHFEITPIDWQKSLKNCLFHSTEPSFNVI